MKRLFAVICVLFSVFSLVGCDKSTTDKVLGIDVCSEFYSEIIYQGDVVCLEEYTALITFESTITKKLSLADIAQGKIDTSSVGVKTLKVKYLNKTISVSYEVYPVEVIDCIYKGSTLTIYSGEKIDLSSVEFTYLCNNGIEGVAKLKDATIGNIKDSNIGALQYLDVSYNEIMFEIPYIVMFREIEELVEYSIIDNVGLYGENYYCIMANNKLQVYYQSGEKRDECSLEALENNQYKIKNKPFGGVLNNILVYRVKDKVVLEKID